MQKIANSGAADTDSNFAGEHDPLGVPWKITRRKEAEPSAAILQKSGDLRGSIKTASGKDFAQWGPEDSGGAAIYAKIHQFGGVIRRKIAPLPKTKIKQGPRQPGKVTIPARPYLGWNQYLEDRTLEHLLDHLKTVINNSASGVKGPAA